MNRKIQESKWKAILKDWKKSGMNQSNYCRANNLGIKAFSNWKGKLIGKEVVVQGNTSKNTIKPAPKKSKVVALKPLANKSKVVTTQKNGTLEATLPKGVVLNFACENKAMLVAAIHTLSNLK